MVKYAIISDRDEIYSKIINKIQNDMDYVEHEIKIDIATNMFKRNIRKNLKDIDLFLVLSKDSSKIIAKLLRWGIPFTKIVTSYEVDEISKYSEVISKIYKNSIVCYSLGEEAVPWYIKMDEVNYDFVRFRTLALVAEQIKVNKIPGNCAEVGVFQGDFARWLNYCFKEKDLYLFDTFEGFDNRDVEEENKIGATEELKDVMQCGFKNTSVEYVLKRMKYAERCKVFKGYFPETAAGVDETFCFVSLDTDLYKPTKDGLNFFYPKITGGGMCLPMIIIHRRVKEYTGQWMNGVKKIVRLVFRFVINMEAVLLQSDEYTGMKLRRI